MRPQDHTRPSAVTANADSQPAASPMTCVNAGTAISKDPDTGQVATKANPALPGFKCPCHGSRYFRDAVNFFGPAPRPMDRVHLEVAPDGKLLVDRSVIVDRAFRLKV